MYVLHPVYLSCDFYLRGNSFEISLFLTFHVNAQVLAAEKANSPGVHGECFFIRDFEDNVVRMAVQCFKRGGVVKAVLIPLWIAFGIAWILDRFERFLHFAYNCVGWKRTTSDDLISVEALSMAWFDIIVSDAKARQRLGYEPVVSKEECLSESAEWVNNFYSELSASPSANSVAKKSAT